MKWVQVISINLYCLRYALPQSKISLEPMKPSEKMLAERLFGKNNLKNELVSNLPTPIPFGLFCRNLKNQEFSGEFFAGFHTKFCNNLKPTPTDVGICLTSNLNIKDMFHIDDDYR